MYPTRTLFSTDIHPPPGWDDTAAGKQGIVLIRQFVPPGTLPVPPSLSFQPARGRKRRVVISWRSVAPRLREESKYSLLGTKMQQSCLLKAGASQNHHTTRSSLETLQKSLLLRGSPALPASAWVNCPRGVVGSSLDFVHAVQQCLMGYIP